MTGNINAVGGEREFKKLNEPEVDSLPGKLPEGVREVPVIKQFNYVWFRGMLRRREDIGVDINGIRARLENK